MPTASERSTEERDRWLDVAGAGRSLATIDVRPIEFAVVGFYDPAADLLRRAADWGYPLESGDLADVARFAAALSATEAEAWMDDDAVTATRALEARRFLAADRIVHWAVPWLDQIGRCYPQHRPVAHDARTALLEIGEEHRLAPALVGGEGLFVPGEDSFGPVDNSRSAPDLLRSLWSGGLLLDATLRSMSGTPDSGRGSLEGMLEGPGFRGDLADLYRVYAARWRSLAAAYPGSGRLWLDLGVRAERTAVDLDD